MKALLFLNAGGQRLLIGPPELIEMNLANIVPGTVAGARMLDTTALADLTSLRDARLPQTLEDFDAAFPQGGS